MGSKCRLFSEDGIVASHAQTVPSCMYLPDESTLNEIKYLFTTLKSTQKGDDYPGGPLNILNVPYSADLALLTSDGNGAVLSLEDVSHRYAFNISFSNFANNRMFIRS